MPLASRARFWFDLAERAAKSAVQGFAGYWLAFQDGDAETLFTTANLKAAVTVAFFSVMMSLVSAKLGHDGDASALPASADPASLVKASAAVAAAAPDDQRTEHEKLAALDVPPPPAELDGGTLTGFPSAKTPAKKAAATKR